MGEYLHGFLRSDKPSLNPVEPGRVDEETVKQKVFNECIRKRKNTVKGNRTSAASRGTQGLK